VPIVFKMGSNKSPLSCFFAENVGFVPPWEDDPVGSVYTSGLSEKFFFCMILSGTLSVEKKKFLGRISNCFFFVFGEIFEYVSFIFSSKWKE